LKASLVVITNTDVVVLAISMFAKLDKLWIAFGKGKDLRWIPIHEISNALGPRALCTLVSCLNQQPSVGSLFFVPSLFVILNYSQGKHQI
jgi:hypothetical protein